MFKKSHIPWVSKNPIDPEEAIREKIRVEERRAKDKARREAKKKADVSRLLIEAGADNMLTILKNAG